MRKALDAKHPAIDRTELERPRRRPASQVRKVHNASGFPDVLVEGRAARLVRKHESDVEHPSGLPGYESAGDPIVEDDEADV
jgi:hypothetical protein